MFEIVRTSIDGCVLLHPKVRGDARGRFVKTMHAGWFAGHGLRSDFPEHYYSVSRAGVLRGLHFQTPPHDHAKLVFCAAGHVLDAVVDVRAGSPTFGSHQLFPLNAEHGTMTYVPPGVAHGFLSLSEDAVVMYHVTSPYSPEHDAGILWSSAGIPWPIETPILSPRDAEFPRLADFQSPFLYGTITQ